MTVNPREYDLGELRAAAGVATEADGDGDGWGLHVDRAAAATSTGRAATFASAAETTFRRRVVETVAEREAATGASDRERPYLGRVPDAYAGVVTALEWLEFLLRQGGRDGASAALEYYESIEWVSPGAAETLSTHLGGLNPSTLGDGPLQPNDHRLSLEYITRIAAATDS